MQSEYREDEILLGALFGDIVGSRFEFNNRKSKHFTLFTEACEPTDDSIMSLAVAEAILDCGGSWGGAGQTHGYSDARMGAQLSRCGIWDCLQ